MFVDPSGFSDESTLFDPLGQGSAAKRYIRNQTVDTKRLLNHEQTRRDYEENTVFNAANFVIDTINNVSKRVAGEDIVKRGGAYKDLTGLSRTVEGHHLVSSDAIKRSSISLSWRDGPAISMSYVDHKKTKSWGPGGYISPVTIRFD